MVKLNSVLKRFLKGIIAGAVSSMALVSISIPNVWSDFSSIFESLALAATFGGLTGLLLALQKWASWKE